MKARPRCGWRPPAADEMDWERFFVLLAVILVCIGFWLLVCWGAAALLQRR